MEKSITLFEKDKDFFVSTNTPDWMQKALGNTLRADGCFFILCVQGECTFQIHLSTHKVKAFDMVCILPKTYFQVTAQSEDCKLYVMGFHNRIIDTAMFITSSMTYLSSLLTTPVVSLRSEWADLYVDYYRLLEKTSTRTDFHVIPEVANHLLLSILQGIIHIHQHMTAIQKVSHGNRAEEIIRNLIQLVMLHYTKQRSVSFYAEQLHVSPQHLSTTVNKVTGRTVTDIIARLVVNDAQAKLKTTNQSIQEIAYGLNFTDISFFGKYFKRYTGMSPKAYRELQRQE